ncbi:hypothetical protein FNV43_RR07205 [Rhamnella rubrinervis]|uniref:Uncharacterized protein n=1 Tax=Rhamnella rubrinervis TaxID=2594499 RepID=A0A8K0MLZ5_9ROSA|nr:hypothetical protein FNV43_RR07205 [Rhamnella rubrinervis]
MLSQSRPLYLRRLTPPALPRSSIRCFLPTLPRLRSAYLLQVSDSSYALQDSVDIPSVDDWGNTEETMGQTVYSSDGDDSDSDFVLTPVSDVDLPAITVSNNDALTVTAHRLAMLGRGERDTGKYVTLENA